MIKGMKQAFFYDEDGFVSLNATDIGIDSWWVLVSIKSTNVDVLVQDDGVTAFINNHGIYDI